MKKLVNWYWEHGIRRGLDPNDPDRETRKVSIGSWLDPVARIIDRNVAIQNNSGQKACLALWGPSQTGKSTMMSRYVDGDKTCGEDSALTWSMDAKTRFSPPLGGVDAIPYGTLVFNPFNFQSDASGVATRYTLRSAEDATVNPNFPIQIKFTSRAQIIQSIALGYLSECEKTEEEYMFTKDSFLKEIESDEIATPDKEAYSLVKDIANVIEFMNGVDRFKNLFKKDEWDTNIRKQFVSSSKLLSSKNEAEKFLAKIFWDSNKELTKFYTEAIQLLERLQNEWSDCTILASMEVGALILDIDSYKSYVSPEGPHGQEVKQKVSNLSFTKVGNEIQVSVNPINGSSTISGDNFGYFQALCAELVVPLKKENLSPITKSAFISLAEKCDFLDFPGVSNRNRGTNNDAENTTLIKLSEANPSELFTKVFKQGKTQCFVYNYVNQYGIDAFSILVRTDRYPSQSNLLNKGICDWLKSFDPNWKEGCHTQLPVFVNMTFFANLINTVSMNGIGNGLNPYIERIQGELKFAQSSKFFATTYHQFPDGLINNLDNAENTIKTILSDPVFIPQTKISEENLRAVYENDGGLDYMFTTINSEINSGRRKERCRDILSKDFDKLSRLISNQLPSPANLAVAARQAKLQACKSSIETKINAFQDMSEFQDLATLLKNLFSASSLVFDPVPLKASQRNRREIIDYIKDQIQNWYEDKISALRDSIYLSSDEQTTILMALRDSIDKEQLFDVLNKQLGYITDRIKAEAARYPFAIAFGNLLQKGTTHQTSQSTIGERNPIILDDFISAIVRRSCTTTGSPHYQSIIGPLLNRIDSLAAKVQGGTRPAQPGDQELQQIYDNIIASKQFQII